MRGLYILATLCFAVSACQKTDPIDWRSMDYGIERAADSYREETHK